MVTHERWGGVKVRDVHYLYHRHKLVMAHQNASKIILKSNAAVFMRNS